MSPLIQVFCFVDSPVIFVFVAMSSLDPLPSLPHSPRAFWDVVLVFPLELQKRLLHFCTGSDRVPVGGMADLNFKITKNDVSTDW